MSCYFSVLILANCKKCRLVLASVPSSPSQTKEDVPPPLAKEKRDVCTSLAETYQNASSWETRRQVLSIMADLTPYSVLQQFIPGITDYRIKVAHQHSIEHGN